MKERTKYMTQQLNQVEQAAYSLIHEDARFIYTLVLLNQSERGYSNYFLMFMPYIGIFAYGAEQWGERAKLDAPRFTPEEKQYYIEVRQSHKSFEKNYREYSNELIKTLNESDSYFYSNRSLIDRIIGYKNVGTDIYSNHYCGNTILCATYNPINPFHKGKEYNLLTISIIAGKLAAFYGLPSLSAYKINTNIKLAYKDFHFFKNCPITMKNELGFVLFSILCSINYILEFIDKIVIAEIPIKFKSAYLLYYYLCGFIIDLNNTNSLNLKLNNSLYSTDLRNCLAHYGLKKYMSSDDIIQEDVLKGLTVKTFGKNYYETKELLFNSLKSLRNQIELLIFK